MASRKTGLSERVNRGVGTNVDYFETRVERVGQHLRRIQRVELTRSDATFMYACHERSSVRDEEGDSVK